MGGDREGGQKRREGIMAQLLNRLRAEERIAGVEFWHSPERCGWLMKQGEYIKTWRRRWFILKQGKIFWFKTEEVGPVSWDQCPPHPSSLVSFHFAHGFHALR